MPRRVPLKPRQKKQGLNFVIKYLRQVIEDENTPPWLRVVCIDRLAIIDHCYDISILPVTNRIQRLPKSGGTTVEPEEEVVSEVEPEPDIIGKQVLDSFNARYFNGGKNG